MAARLETKAAKLWSKATCELLALHEIFRKLGFQADDLYIEQYSDPKMFFKAVQGALEFRVEIHYDISKVIEEWPLACEWWNNASQEDLRELYETSEARLNAPMMVFALSEKGFDLTRPDWLH